MIQRFLQKSFISLPQGKNAAEVTKGKKIIKAGNLQKKDQVVKIKNKDVVSIDSESKNKADNDKKSSKAAIHYVKDEVIIKFQRGVTDKEIEALLKKRNLVDASDETLKKIGYRKVTISDKQEVMAVIKELRKERIIKTPEPNFTANVMSAQDLLYPSQWYVQDAHFDAAWEKVKNNSKIKVAVIDTGVDSNHPDLKGKTIDGYNFVNNTADATDDHGHGTFVAGIISANANDIGIKGLYANSLIIPVKVIDDSGYGTYEDVGKGIIYAVDKGAKVINLSIGGSTYSSLLNDAVDYALSNGCIVVAAGGNDGIEQEIFPAAYPDVIGVSALGYDGQIWNHSNSGKHIDVSAPGIDIISTSLNGDYVYASGTSASTAMVSALVAMLISEKPNLSSSFIERLIIQNTKDLGETGRDKIYGNGEIDANAVLDKEVEAFHDAAVRSIKVEPMVFEKDKPVYVVADILNLGTYEKENVDVVLYEIEGDVKKEVERKTGVEVVDKSEAVFEWKPKNLVSLEVVVSLENDVTESNNSQSTNKFTVKEEGGLYVLYDTDPPVHQYIAEQAVKKLPDGPLKNALNSNLETLKTGAKEEDEGTRLDPQFLNSNSDINKRQYIKKYCYHFWDPDNTNDNSGLIEVAFDVFECNWDNEINHQFYSAYYIAKTETYKNAIDEYKKGKTSAYYWLGRTAHLLMDMSVPEHVQLDPHVPLPNNAGRSYEYYVSKDDNYKNITFESDHTEIPSANNLKDIFNDLAQYTDGFDSFDVKGDSDPYGKGKYNGIPLSPHAISDNDLKTIYQPLLQGAAIGYVAALYELFWKETHPTPFNDVTQGWYYYYVIDLYEKGIVKGVDGKFIPDREVNLAEFITRVVASKYYPDYKDGCKTSTWYSCYKDKAIADGLITTFNPSEIVTRGKTAEIIARSCGKKEDFISFVKEKGIMLGFPDDDFKENNNLNRAQAAVIIWKRFFGSNKCD